MYKMYKNNNNERFEYEAPASDAEHTCLNLIF